MYLQEGRGERHNGQNHHPAGCMSVPFYSASVPPMQAYSYSVSYREKFRPEMQWVRYGGHQVDGQNVSRPTTGRLLQTRTIPITRGMSTSTMAMITGTISQITIMLGVCAVD